MTRSCVWRWALEGKIIPHLSQCLIRSPLSLMRSGPYEPERGSVEVREGILKRIRAAADMLRRVAEAPSAGGHHRPAAKELLRTSTPAGTAAASDICPSRFKAVT